MTAWSRLRGAVRAGNPLRRVEQRLLLSRAKHRSLAGHANVSRRVAELVPFYAIDDAAFFAADGAPAEVAELRRRGFERLSALLRSRAPRTIAETAALAETVSDVAFVDAYRVPFPFRDRVRRELAVGALVEESRDGQVKDLDGNWAYDLSGSYGVNLFGYDAYKRFLDDGAARARSLGPVLGAYHPVVVENVARLRAISGLDEVSFHMSGTEAVMQAARLARYHTRRSHVVRFCGSYHGWWDGVQPGVGNPRPSHEVYTLEDMSPVALRVLAERGDVACVLVNPLQCMSPNGAAPGDSTLVGARAAKARPTREAYARWLADLRAVCTRRGIPLVMDEVFLGFRLAPGGAQEYFGVKADLVTYGKTLGGGLPVGVLCGRRDLMRRFRDDHPSDVCFARGTFNTHPYVMTSMNEFLRYLDRPEVRATYDGLDDRWDGRARALNDRLAALGLPVRLANLTSVWTTEYTAPGRYHWMLQFYLRAQGLALSWVGTGRFIFGHDTTDAAFAAIADRFVAAAAAMADDGFFWRDAALTEANLRRRVLREVVVSALPRWRGSSGR